MHRNYLRSKGFMWLALLTAIFNIEVGQFVMLLAIYFEIPRRGMWN